MPQRLYCQIVRWNGPLGDFTFLFTGNVGVVNGDVVKATAIGNTITMYINNVAIASVVDNTFPSGNPGMGFYMHGGLGPPLNYGFSSYTASDDTPTPTPTPTPTASPTPTPTATTTPAPTVTPTATPTQDQCEVPNFIGTKLNRARSIWNDAGFTTEVVVVPDPDDPGMGKLIIWQSLPQGFIGSCPETTIIVSSLPQGQ